MLEYPTGLSAAACARIETALIDAELAYLEAARKARGPSGVIYRGELNLAALDAVLCVFEVVLQTLTDDVRDAESSAEKLRTDAERWLEELTTRAYMQKHSKSVTPVAFATRVHRAVQARPWWTQFLIWLRERAEPPSIPVQLRRRMKRAGWTVPELAKKMGINPSNAYDHQSGKSTPRPNLLRKYSEVFIDALGPSGKLDL